jgi:hypothetical protein
MKRLMLEAERVKLPLLANKIDEFVEVLSHRVEERIRAMGFGGLLKLKAKKLSRKATVWYVDVYI